VDRLRERASGGYYQLLEVDPDASVQEIGAAVAALKRRLDAIDPVLDGELAAFVNHLSRRLAQAWQTLGDPEGRAWHDAVLGNYRGVGRCLSAGLKTETLDRLNRRWSEQYPERASKARSLANSSLLHLRAQDRLKGLDCLRRALEVAPLSVELHRRYWALEHDMPQGLRATN
jgi:serine/threonine-protein kinase